MIYLDNNATTRPYGEVIEAISGCLLNHWQNPSAVYSSAKSAREAVEEARTNVAALVGADPDEIIFTSGGTEATNTVLNTWIYGEDPSLENRNIRNNYGASCPVLVTLTTEHPATLKVLEAGRKRGKCGTMHVEVDHNGMPLLDVWEEAVGEATGATFCMANNETGVISPVQELVEACRRRGVPVHVDAVQAIGKIPVNFHEMNVDYASLSSHKIHGPKGVGAIYCRRGMFLEPLIAGGGQEGGHRSGTTNVPGIIGFGVAAKIISQALEERRAYMTHLRDKFEAVLMSELTGVRVNGIGTPRLPNTSNVTFEGCSSEGLMLLLGMDNVCCSVASACKAGTNTPSSVLTAMGLDPDMAKSSLRFSLSSQTTEEEIDMALVSVIHAVNALRSVQSPYTGPVTVYKP